MKRTKGVNAEKNKHTICTKRSPVGAMHLTSLTAAACIDAGVKAIDAMVSFSSVPSFSWNFVRSPLTSSRHSFRSCVVATCCSVAACSDAREKEKRLAHSGQRQQPAQPTIGDMANRGADRGRRTREALVMMWKVSLSVASAMPIQFDSETSSRSINVSTTRLLTSQTSALLRIRSIRRHMSTCASHGDRRV